MPRRARNIKLNPTLDAMAWIEQGCQRGIGEVLLNSMDNDGVKAGFDLEMISAVRPLCSVPLIASGGAGSINDFAAALVSGADALLAASVFHFGSLSIAQVKNHLSGAGFTVRESDND